MSKVFSDSPIVLQNSQAGNADGNVADVTGYSLLGLQVLVAGGFNGAVNFEATIDNTNWAAIGVKNSAGSIVTTANANGIFTVDAPAYNKVRARTSGVSAGTTTVTLVGKAH